MIIALHRMYANLTRISFGYKKEVSQDEIAEKDVCLDLFPCMTYVFYSRPHD